MKRNTKNWTKALAALVSLAVIGGPSLGYAGGKGNGGGVNGGGGGSRGGNGGGSSRMSSSMSRGNSGGSSMMKSSGGSNFKSNSLSSRSQSFSKNGGSSNFGGSQSFKNLNKGNLGGSNLSKNLGGSSLKKFPSVDLSKSTRVSDLVKSGKFNDQFKQKFPGNKGPNLNDKITKNPKFPGKLGDITKYPNGKKPKFPIDNIVGKPKFPGPVIDPGIGNGKPGKGKKDNHDWHWPWDDNHHGHHHGNHHGNHHGHHHGNHHNHGHWYWDDYFGHHHGHDYHYCPPVIIHYPFPEPVTEIVVVEKVVPVQPVVATNATARNVDVQLIEVRQVDAGDAEKQEGPMLRVLVRNNGTSAITTPFDIALVATAGGQPTENSPYAIQKVERIDAGQTVSADVRLPAEASAIGLTADGQPEPFKSLFAAADVAQQIAETDEANNATALDRSVIKQVDPSAVAVNR